MPFEVETILDIPICYHAQEDQLIWVGNKNGTFTVKSAYYVARKILEGNSRENHLLETKSFVMEKDVALKHPSKGKNFCLEAMFGCNPHNAKFK